MLNYPTPGGKGCRALSNAGTAEQTGRQPSRPLFPEHCSDLESSGLNDATVQRCEFYSTEGAEEVRRLLGWSQYHGQLGACLVIPYFNLDGSLNGYHRLKPSRPRKDKNSGKLVKYEAPKGLPSRAYFPPGVTLSALPDQGRPLLITEGEKKAAKADQEGFPCVGLAGVYAWQRKRPRGPDHKPVGDREFISDLDVLVWQGRRVFIAFDSDAATKPDVRWAEWHLAQALRVRGAAVRVVRLPAGPGGSKVGLDDFLCFHGPEGLRRLIDSATEPERPPPSSEGVQGGGREGKKSVATCLVELALANGTQLFHTPEPVGYAIVPVQGHQETWALRSDRFRRFLFHLYYERFDRVPGAQAVADAAAVLEGKALHDGPEAEIHVRLAEAAGKIYLDLADPSWRAVEVSAAGWRLVDRSPVRFRRARGMLPLPPPRGGGRVDLLREFANVPGADEWRLLVAWVLQAFRPRGPFPVLCLHGEQGSAKSTLTRLVRLLIDPNVAPLRKTPREDRDLMIAAKNNWLVPFDNLSCLPDWLSDAICRLATGGGYATRALYTDDEEAIFNATRPVILNGIEDAVPRGDLLERALILVLRHIPQGKRRTEREFWSAFEVARPLILGALLGAVSGALGRAGEVRLEAPPRMADFAEWVTAAERALGWESGSFLKSYRDNRATASELALEASPLAALLRQFVERCGRWEGTAADLLKKLTALVEEEVAKSKKWPKAAHVLSNRLRRLAPDQRGVGLAVEFGGRTRDRQRARLIRLALEGQEEKQGAEAPEVSGASEGPEESKETGNSAGRTRTLGRGASDASPDGPDSAKPGGRTLADAPDASDAPPHSFSDDDSEVL